MKVTGWVFPIYTYNGTQNREAWVVYEGRYKTKAAALKRVEELKEDNFQVGLPFRVTMEV